MIGSLHVDVFNQSKYMSNGVTMKVTMTQSKDLFVRMAKGDVTETLKADILSVKLFMRKLKITHATRTHSPTKYGIVPYNARRV